MNLVIEKSREVVRTLIPVIVMVLFISLTMVKVETDILIRFIVGSILLLIGLSVFLWGVDLAMNPIGHHMSMEIATSRSPFKIALLSFLLGFLVNVAEPDLIILGSQIETASGGTMSGPVIVYVVSVGVGVLVLLGVFRLLKGKPLNAFMAVTYGTILLLAFFVSQEFLAISFDASGATTGAFTTPFVLALSLGLSQAKGGKSVREDSFGLVGTMSSGPILAIMLMSIITGQKHIQGEALAYVIPKGVIGPILNVLPKVLLESIIALLPLSVLFFGFNMVKFKIKRDEFRTILKGIIATTLGLALFLAAVNSGFMDMGRILGMELAKLNHLLLIVVAFFMGFIVVLVEPAVHVLGGQIEQVTGGHIPVKLIRLTLSIGVGLAMALSMIRIIVPDVRLWFFLLPGFAIGIFLSFRVDPVFVGIAYDAGGVASGPMTATFVLAFAQGASLVIETADVMVDGFGIIAMVAMAPVFSIMVLGTIFKYKRVSYPEAEKPDEIPEEATEEEIPSMYACIMAVVNWGFADGVVDLARKFGATGATIIHGRGTDPEYQVVLPILNVELQPEKEIILMVVDYQFSTAVAENLINDPQLKEKADISIFISPANPELETFITE